MIRCVLPRSSRLTNWLTTVDRNHGTKPISRERGKESHRSSPSAHEPKGRADGAATEDEVRPSIDRFEDRPISEDAPLRAHKLRELPLSPLMDPEVFAASGKHKASKRPPSKGPALFQQQLAKNPYAQALATPVRQCQVTDTRLPSYFLQDLQVMGHPETGEPWWIPKSLRKKCQDVGNIAGNNDTTAIEVEEEWSQEKEINAEGVVAHVNEPLSIRSEARQSRPLPFGSGVYILSCQALLVAMTSTTSRWNMPPWKLFTTGSTKNSAIARKVINHTSWRKDMDSFVLELMRRRIVEGLIYLVQRRRGYLAACMDWANARMAGRQQEAILWTGTKVGIGLQEPLGIEAAVDEKAILAFNEAEDRSTTFYPGRDDPPGFATLTIGKDKAHMVPVHNLETMLGTKHLMELRRKYPIFNNQVLLVRGKKMTIDLQMKLWKLQVYLGYTEVRPREPRREGLAPTQQEAILESDVTAV